MGSSDAKSEDGRSCLSADASVNVSERPLGPSEPVTAVSGGGRPAWSGAMVTTYPQASRGSGENLLSRLDRAGEVEEAQNLRARIRFGESVAEKSTKRLLDQRSMSAGAGQVENQRSLHSGFSQPRSLSDAPAGKVWGVGSVDSQPSKASDDSKRKRMESLITAFYSIRDKSGGMVPVRPVPGR